MLRILLLFCLALLVAAPARALTVGFLPGAGELDSPFNMLVYEGIARGEKELGLTVRARQGLEGELDQEMAARQMASMLRQPVDVVVGTGVEWADAVSQAAQQNPEVRFIIVDAEVRGLPNVVSVLFANEQGGFLAGCLAGYMTTTDLVGFIGGVPIPAVRAFRHGYAQGLDYAAPEAGLLTRYLSEGRDFSGFHDPDGAAETAASLYAQGVDIIFAAAGESGLGVLQQAAESDRYAIGVDYDQDAFAKGHVLASVVKRVDKAVFEELQRIVEDAFLPGVHVYGVRDGGLGLSEMQHTRDKIPHVVQEKLLEVEEKIRHGVLEVQKLPVSPTRDE